MEGFIEVNEVNTTLTLRKSNPKRDDMWEIVNSYGNPIVTERHFLSKDDAIAWANSFISSWIGIKLRIED